MNQKAFPAALLFLAAVTLFPTPSQAQTVTDSVEGMQTVLDRVYREMLPLCSELIDIGRGLAGFGAFWFIGSRAWRQIAAAEPIDLYPLLRPFALGMAILLFPSVLSLMNGILDPIVRATGGMVRESNRAIAVLLAAREKAVRESEPYQMYVGDDGLGDSDKWYRYTHPEDPDRAEEGLFEGIGNDIRFWMDKQSYAFRHSVKQWMSEVLEVIYAAASLCINTLRTFFLIVLAILGPLVLGFSVYDGFQHTLTVWIARYINIFLWLPVANIFGSILGKIQENMLKLDLSQIEAQGDTFFSSTDTAYLIFLLIGIIGYFAVPNVANYIVHAGGGNAILQKVNSVTGGATTMGMQAGMSGAGMVTDALGDAARQISQGYAPAGQTDYFSQQQNNAFMQDKISGR
ncbi:MAG: conjugative transposon protein TraJ [Mucilaginibacter polytrichastri]|nr:conjugative transposon protein TraJ [Mucilaginibacter polytrichastri]